MTNVLKAAVDAHRGGDLASAQALYKRTIAVANHNLAEIAERLGRPEESIFHLREALAADPGREEAANNLAMALLRAGEYLEGWSLYERRRRLDRFKLWKPPADWQEWKGEDLAGKRLGVIGEQGLGDQIQFARYVQVLRDRGAVVHFVCAPSLVSLLDGGIRLSGSEIDYWTYLMSLPFWLRTTLDNIPPPVRIPVERRGGGGVGVMPTGYTMSVHHQWDERADIQARMLALGRDLRPEKTGAKDFLDTAQIVAGLDLVITVDTAMAHLAGSIGVSTWVLLPTPVADWRWLLNRSDSPWYPSVRLFRQPSQDDWAGVLDAVEVALAGSCRAS